ncbi:disulfide bond formation protein B [Burkholderiaceae bacterium UC74_6]
MFIQPSKLPARALAGIAVASFASVAIALIAQHQFGVKPCPWCVMQRGIFLLIGALALIGLLLRGVARRGALLLVAALAIAGVASAYYQHEVASLSFSCAQTLADRVINALGLEELWPYGFMVTGSCADAASYRLLGLPYEVWSGLLYLLTLGAAFVAFKASTKGRRH